MYFYSSRLGKPFIALASLVLILSSAAPCLGERRPPPVSSAPPWTLLQQSDDAKSGYVLHRRETAGSSAATFRLEAIVDSPADLVAVAAAKNLVDPEHRQANTEKTILRNDAEAIVIYSHIHIDAPFVSDRDVISRVERSYDPESQTHRFDWKAIDEGPPKKEGVIRLERSEGYWTFSPEAEGTTRAVYVSHTETAGFVPGWLVNSQMAKTMVEGIEGLRRAVDREQQRESR